MRPNDKDAKLKYQECNKIVKQKAFERAIASDELKRSVVDSLDIENMSKSSFLLLLIIVLFNFLSLFLLSMFSCPVIEDEYVGPKLEDGKVTVKFMKELMEWFKDQKKLHRKCAYQVSVTARP